MSNRNRLKKKVENKKRISDKFLFQGCVIVAVVCLCLMMIVFVKINETNNLIKTENHNMTLGVDYFYEDVTITAKDYESSYSTLDSAVETTNYYLYYSPNEKLFVDEKTYDSCDVGDTIKAYTKDHETYYFKLIQLSGKRYTNNEILKSVGAVLGVIAIFFFVCAWVFKK